MNREIRSCECGFSTFNNKSFSNHVRFGCPKSNRLSNVRCKQCNEFMPLRKPSEQGLYCNNKCYGDWASANLRGENGRAYVHGKCRENLLIRASREYKAWRLAVIERDGGKCVMCKSERQIEVDHIKDFALYPELRFDINNGRVLCKPCHKNTNNYGFKKSNSKKRN